jgi:putative zinc finger/helix-turn-helix YgiT family protein
MSDETRPVKPYPWKCDQCRRRTVKPATVDYSVSIEHDGRTFEVAVTQLQAARCEACGEIVLDDEANERISKTFRAQLGLLTPAQIRQNRERLGLSAQQLANALGIAEASLSRLETGGQIQPRALDRLLRLYFGCEQVRTVLADEAQLASLVAAT